MKNRGGRWLGLAALAVVSGVAAGCGGAAADANGAVAGREDGEQAGAPRRVVNVEVMTVQPERFAEQVTVTGVVQADRDVMVASEEGGVIRSVHVEKGARVSEGDPIATIDDRLLRAQYDQAKAEAALARETWERQRRLWEQDSIGTELAYLRARYGAETAEANARALETRLARTTVRAPISGTIEERAVEVGSTVMPGSPVARVVDADPVKVTAGIPERFAGDIRAGGEATVAFDHLPGREFRGRLVFVGTAVNESNRTFPVEVAIANPGGALKPGMVAKVQTSRSAQRQALVVPRDAVLRVENGYIVYVVRDTESGSMAEARPVMTGAGAGGRVLIESGLAAGDRVIVIGQQQLTSGDAVQIVAGVAGSAR